MWFAGFTVGVTVGIVVGMFIEAYSFQFLDRLFGKTRRNRHVEGCGTQRRGCMPGCDNYDPKWDA
jgi:hypothetical protein